MLRIRKDHLLYRLKRESNIKMICLSHLRKLSNCFGLLSFWNGLREMKYWILLKWSTSCLLKIQNVIYAKLKRFFVSCFWISRLPPAAYCTVHTVQLYSAQPNWFCNLNFSSIQSAFHGCILPFTLDLPQKENWYSGVRIKICSTLHATIFQIKWWRFQRPRKLNYVVHPKTGFLCCLVSLYQIRGHQTKKQFGWKHFRKIDRKSGKLSPTAWNTGKIPKMAAHLQM